MKSRNFYIFIFCSLFFSVVNASSNDNSFIISNNDPYEEFKENELLQSFIKENNAIIVNQDFIDEDDELITVSLLLIGSIIIQDQMAKASEHLCGKGLEAINNRLREDSRDRKYQEVFQITKKEKIATCKLAQLLSGGWQRWLRKKAWRGVISIGKYVWARLPKKIQNGIKSNLKEYLGIELKDAALKAEFMFEEDLGEAQKGSFLFSSLETDLIYTYRTLMKIYRAYKYVDFADSAIKVIPARVSKNYKQEAKKLNKDIGKDGWVIMDKDGGNCTCKKSKSKLKKKYSDVLFGETSGTKFHKSQLPPVEVNKVLTNQTLRGSVYDEKGTPLIGANVTIKGTSSGAATDLNGNFQLEMPIGSSELLISYTGFSSKKVYARGKQDMIIRLRRRSNFGIRAGGVYSIPILDQALQVDRDNPLMLEEYDLAGSWEAGFYFRKSIIEIGIQYAERSHYFSSIHMFNDPSGITINRTIDERNRLGYIQMPLTLNFRLGKNILFHIGGYGGYLLQAKGILNLKDQFIDNSGNQITDEQKFEVNYFNITETPEYGYNDKPFQSYDYGALVGFDFFTSRRLNLGLRYYHGLSNINNQDNWERDNSKSTLQLNQGSGSLHLRFNLF